MSFSFEVRESDLLGRIGTLRVGGKTLETPCLMPVIHPVSQAVPVGDLRAMGFKALMTNSYIIYSRRREEAIEKGIHQMLGFDGVFMTDSGGYQVLEYGGLELSYDQVAEFQAGIGSELAVTLDRPTGYPQSRAYAKETVEYSLENAVATLKEFGAKATTWVGPVQGGLYQDLVRKSAKALVKSRFEFLALGSPVQVMQNYMFADLVSMVVAARSSMPYSVPLHLFGAGHPLTMALAVALGCDTFDSASYILFARSGRYMTRSVVMTLDAMKFLPCSCPVCSRTSVRGLLDLEFKERTKNLAEHNLWVLREEMEACKQAIAEGRLWDLVEEKSMAHPRLREAFAVLPRHYELLAGGTPLLKERGLFIRSAEDLSRPEVLSAVWRLKQATRRDSQRATVLLSDPTNPVGKKGPHRGSGKKSDVYRLHPALGLYPSELDFVFPFTQSTTSQGTANPPSLKEALASLKAMGYRLVKVGKPEPPARRKRVRSRRSRRGPSPSPRSASSPPRSPRRP
ncbi:MAG: tRNA guanosine(15) transglycosylase TgtA [Thaumarchaeota archaeon]|nr:tRNA guanosine(15) transglycosylase TgtA [Nitrososphaerota archaeon]